MVPRSSEVSKQLIRPFMQLVFGCRPRVGRASRVSRVRGMSPAMAQPAITPAAIVAVTGAPCAHEATFKASLQVTLKV